MRDGSSVAGVGRRGSGQRRRLGRRVIAQGASGFVRDALVGVARRRRTGRRPVAAVTVAPVETALVDQRFRIPRRRM